MALALYAGVVAHGQKLQDMPLRYIVEQTEMKIAEGKFAEVAPLLDELEARFSDTKDAKIKLVLQKFGFIRGIAFLQAYAKSNDNKDLEKSADAFGDFAEKFPQDPKAVLALEKRTVCLRALGFFLKAAVDIEKLLDETGPYFAKLKKPSRILDLRYGLAQCYHIEQQWAKGEPAFNKLRQEAEKVEHDDYLSYAVSCLTEMYITLAEKDRSKLQQVEQLLPYLSGDTPARYDLRLNLNLFKAAMYHKDDKAFVKASLFLALTMVTEEISGYYNDRLERLRTQQVQLTSFLKLHAKALPKRRRDAYQERLNEIAFKVSVAQRHKKAVEGMDSYTTTLRWRKAENFQDVKRDWEAFWAFYWLYKDEVAKNKERKSNEMAENFLYAAFASANKVKFRVKVIELGNEYLDNKSWNKFRVDITQILANAYREEAITNDKAANDPEKIRQKAENERKREHNYGEFFRLCDGFITDLPKHDYTKNFIAMMAAAYLAREKPADLLYKFAGIRDGKKDSSVGYLNDNHYKDCPALGACSYFVGMVHLMKGNAKGAKEYLEPIVGVSVRGLPIDNQTPDATLPKPE